jgi:hypothetical protein
MRAQDAFLLPTLKLKLKLKSAYGGGRRSAMRGFGGV